MNTAVLLPLPPATPATEAPKIDATILDTRAFEYKDGVDSVKIDIDFLTIDKPEKWQPASVNRSSLKLKTINSNKYYAFNLYGVSYKDYEAVEMKYVIPPVPRDANDNEIHDDKNYLAEVERIVFARKIAVIELSTKMEINGKTIDEKAAFLKQRCGGEIETLFMYIWNTMMCQSDGSLYDSYRTAMMLGAENDGDCIEMTSFSQWDTAEMNVTRFIFQHRDQKFLTEIPLRLISASDAERIETEAKMPIPPLAPKTVNGRRTGETYRNYNDANYKAKLRDANRRRNIMLLQSALPFQIPGRNINEQTDWIMDRPVGDVARLIKFIEDEVLGYGSRLDFFTKG